MELSCPECHQQISVDHAASTDAGPMLGNTIAEVDCPNCGSVVLPVDADATLSYMQEQIPDEARQVGHFKLIRMLGAGAFGAVWLADDQTLGRQVALKLQISSDQDVDSLLHEAHTAAGLDHPNIVSIYEVGREEGRVFVASQYLEGLTLQNLLSQGRPPLRRSCQLAVTISRALHYAHQHGVVHRDIKPANIILDAGGQPCIADFGLAKRLSVTKTISLEGQVLGTARYMSPEQAAGRTQATDHRSDIYSVGVTLFQMLTGHLPFRGNVQAVLHQKMFEDAPSLRELDPSIPRDLETICLKCLERDPDRRYQSGEELADELERFLEGRPVLARPISRVERLWRWCQRRPAISSLLLGLFLSLATGLLGVSLFWRQAERSDAFTRRALYRAQMNLAAEYVSRADIEALRQSLDRFRQKDRLAGLRGFEWYYFDGLTRVLHRTLHHGSVVTDVAVSSDGTQAASLGSDRSIRRWDTETGDLIATLTLSAGRHLVIDFVPGSSRLAAGASDGLVRVWNAAGGSRPVAQFLHGPPVTFLSVSADGTQLLAAGRQGAVRIWDLRSEELTAEIPTGQGQTRGVEFSPDGTTIAVAKQDGRIRITSVDTGSVVQILQDQGQIESLAFSPAGDVLATGAYTGMLRLWSVQDGSEVRQLDTALGLIGEVRFLEDHLLAATGISGRLLVLETRTGRTAVELPTHSLSEGCLDLSPGRETIVVGSGDGGVRLINQAELLARRVLWHAAPVRALQFNSAGESLLAADESGASRRWSVIDRTGEPLPAGSRNDSVDAGTAEMEQSPGRPVTAFQPDGELIAQGLGRQLTLHRIATGEVVHQRTSAAGRLTELQFSPDGRQLLLITESGTALVVPAGEGPMIEFRPGGERERQIRAAVWSPDGRSVTLATAEGTLWSAATADGGLEPLLTTDQTATALVWCGDGDRLGIATESGELILYQVTAPDHRMKIKAHGGRINALAVFPDGQTLVSGGRDRQLKLWDVTTGERLTTLHGHGRQIFSIAISPDGRMMASGGLAGDIRLWTGSPR